MPDLQVNSTSTKKNYDDNPLIDGQCNKVYPSLMYSFLVVKGTNKVRQHGMCIQLFILEASGGSTVVYIC